MWPLNRKKRRIRKVFGFSCDPKLAVGVRMIAADLEVPIYVVAEHLLQLGAAQIYPDLEDEEAKRQLQEHLVSHHLLRLALGEEDEYDAAAVAKIQEERRQREAKVEAALELIRIHELGKVPLDD